MKKPILILLFIAGILYAGTLIWQSDLIFSHQFHAQDAEATCEDCHGKAMTSITGFDDLLPEMETCWSCHDEGADCEMCHKNGEDPVLLPRVSNYAPKFNHKLHIDNGATCASCHTNIADKSEVNSGMHLPVMDDCMDCHETPETTAGCYKCHTLDQELKPVDHALTWNHSHGVAAQSGSQNCNSCHTEQFCTECHYGENLQSETHPADFIATHGMAFVMRESDCGQCHDNKNDCIDCHRYVNNIKPVNHNISTWKEKIQKDDIFEHAAEAKADPEICTVCHVQNDPVCLDCHPNF